MMSITIITKLLNRTVSFSFAKRVREMEGKEGAGLSLSGSLSRSLSPFLSQALFFSVSLSLFLVGTIVSLDLSPSLLLFSLIKTQRRVQRWCEMLRRYAAQIDGTA